MDESHVRHADGADREVRLPVECLDLLDRPLLAVVATVGPGGAPQATPVWVLRRGEAAVFNTTSRRAKGQNLGRDPRVALCVLDDQDPYRYLQVQGIPLDSRRPKHDRRARAPVHGCAVPTTQAGRGAG